MFHFARPRILPLFGFLLTSAACGGNLGSDEAAPPIAPVSPPGTEVRVLVLEPGRKPVVGATVKFGSTEKVTDASGWATLLVSQTGRISGVVSKPGYAPASAVLALEPDLSTFTQTTLLKIAGSTRFLAERGLLYRVGRTEVEVPPGAFVDESGKKVYGWVKVDVTPADPRQLDDVAPPWPLQGQTKPLGPGLFAMNGITDIYSLGMADWTFTEGGQPVKLAAGAKAKLRFWLDDEDADDEIVDSPTRKPPMWWYRYTDGLWVQDGNCTVHRDRDGKKYCEASVTHFTPWNADWPYATNDCTRVQVVHARTGASIPNVGVAYELSNKGLNGADFTNASGYSCADLQQGDSLRFTARASGFTGSSAVVSTGSGMAGVTCRGTPSACSQVQIALCPSGEDCSCPAATPNKCGAVCVSLQSDFKNCGACGKTCGANQDCKAGRCVCTNATLTACGDQCVNTTNDSNNCGGCGTQCDSTLAGGTCVASSCRCTGVSSADCKSGAGVAPRACVSTDADVNNCGACGNACAAAERCLSGKCVSMWNQTPLPVMTDKLTSISASGPDATFAVGGAGGFFRLDRSGMAPVFRKEGIMDPMGVPIAAQLLGIFVETGDQKSVVGAAGTWLWQDSTGKWESGGLGAARQGNAVYGVRRADPSTPIEAYVALADGSQRTLYGNTVQDDTVCPGWKLATTQLRAIWARRDEAAMLTQTWAVGDTSRLVRMTWSKGSCTAWSENKAYDSVSKKELTLRGLWGLSDRVLIAVGSSGTILRTSDGGDTWSEVRAGSAELNAVAGSENGKELFAVGNGGLILRSTNNGTSWLQEPIPGLTQNLLAVSVGPGKDAGSTEVVVGGEGVALIRSSQ